MSENAGSIFYSVDIETTKTLAAQQKIDQGFDKLQTGMDKTDKSATRLGGGLSKLALSIAAVVSAGAIREMAGLVQKYQEMAERVQMATSSQAEFETVQKRLLNTANQTYRRLDEAQELYIRTADSLRSMGYSTAQALDVTDSLSFAFVKNATSMERANNAISAVSKSINKGTVEADAWETLLAAVPTVIEDIAAASGKTAAEIRELGAAGDITAAQLTEGLRKSLDENTKAAAGMAANLTDAGVRAQTAITAVLVSLEKQTGVLQAVTDGIIEAANAVLEFGGDTEKMTAFLDNATTAATALAVVLGARLLSAMSGYTAAVITQAAASVQATRAADANLRLTQAEAAAAANALMQAKATAQATVGLSTHTAAVNTLSAAQARATAATGSLLAAQAGVAGAMRVTTAVVGGLRAAMALLGGPAGVIFLAVGALAAFATSATNAKPPIDLLTGSIKDFTDAQRDLAKIQIAEQLRDLRKEAEDLTAAMQRSESFVLNERGQRVYAERRVELERLNKEIDAYSTRLEDLQNIQTGKPAGAPDTPAPVVEPVLTSPAVTTPKVAKKTDAERAAEAIREQVAALQLQADTLGMTAAELEIYKLQLAGATDEQIRAAQSSLSAVEAYEAQTEAADALAKSEEEKRKKLEEAAKTVTPARAAENEYLTDLAQYQAMLDAKLISDQEYLMLKNQAETDYDAQRLAAQEAMFVSMSAGNAVLMDGINALDASAATAFSGILSGSTNGEEAMRSLANTIFNSVISSIVQMGIEQVKSLIMGQTAAAAAAATGVATAATLSTAYATPAALVSLASFGANAAPAAAGIASTVALSQGLSAVTGRAMGGPTQAGNMYRVNEGGAPEIFNAANGQQYMMANQRGEVVSNKDARGDGGAVTVNVTVMQSSEKAGTVERRQDGETEAIDIFVADIGGGGRASRTLEQTYGLQRQGR